jgi:SAM-dependent methyltransferase
MITLSRISDFEDSNLFSEDEIQEITRLLRISKHKPPELEDIWYLMDFVWDELGCNNTKLDPDKISRFYSNPIWMINGIFIEEHPLSLQHRHSISQWVKRIGLKKIVDFGGGLGTLGRILAQNIENAEIDIYEPYPCKYALGQVEKYDNLKFISSISGQYDCLISTDVLEHVPDPLRLLSEMIDSVKIDGYLVIAHHFHPCIKCHLPSTFHFCYSFDEFTEAMGLKKIGLCEGSHAFIYQKSIDKAFDWDVIREMEKKSIHAFPRREFYTRNLRPWANRFSRLFTDPVGLIQSVKSRL